MITVSQLTAFLPKLKNPDTWTLALGAAAVRFKLDTNARTVAFLAQVAHESAGFSRMVENLNYTAKRMTQVWPKRFKTLEAAQVYAGQPEKLANHVYAKIIGNGDEANGDGWRFRGRGLIQLTGRNNYLACGKALQLDLIKQPELVEQPDIAALAAAHYWHNNGLNEPADIGDDASFVTITKRINRAAEGLEQRRVWWKRAKLALA